MKFTHLADCHIGSWRDPKMQELSLQAFAEAIQRSIAEHVDFLLIAGDLFNTSLPAIDRLKQTVTQLKSLKDNNIPVYAIPGSHDYSPSGKTMLDVLEEAGLLINVVKGSITEEKKLRLQFTIDKKTGAKITGMLGRRGTLEKVYYDELDRTPLEAEPGFKIFLFHTAIAELKPENLEHMDTTPISLLPKGFDYYAGGHVHIVKNISIDGYKNVVYPGPLFPNSFHELEELKCGGFYIYDIYDNDNVQFYPIEIYPVISLCVECNYVTPAQVRDLFQRVIIGKKMNNVIVTLRFTGTLEQGTVADVDLRTMINQLYDMGAYMVLRNTASLASKDFASVKIAAHSIGEIEDTIIQEHLGQFPLFADERNVIRQLMQSLNAEKAEGERIVDFEKRLTENIDRII